MVRRNVTEQFVDDAIAAVKASILDTLELKIASINEQPSNEIQKNETKKLWNHVNKLEDEVDELYDRIKDLETALYDQQQRSRRNNLEIHGLPNDILDENLEKNIVEILNNIVEVPINLSEIEACHRLPSRNGPKPVIIRFLCRKRRNEVMENASNVNNHDLTKFGMENNQKIYINNNLSPKMKELSYYCRRLRRDGKLKKITFDNAKLKIKITENGQWKRISHEDDIIFYFPDFHFENA